MPSSAFYTSMDTTTYHALNYQMMAKSEYYRSNIPKTILFYLDALGRK